MSETSAGTRPERHAFDNTQRNALAKMVGRARERLKLDLIDQLRRLGFQDDGTVLDLGRIAGLDEGERAAGLELRALLEHFVAAETSPPGPLSTGGGEGRAAGGRGRSRGGGEGAARVAAYARLLREIGFTTFNRLVALRMAEERGLIVQAVGGGLGSTGFQVYEQVANGALGSRAETYRAYVESLYDELAVDLPALFDRANPESRVFPSERCLEDVLALIDAEDLAALWREDEAIGWVYQYYNDPAERKRMRDESSAPRNSRELAVRNQFFTPRYVVEFLTDNTLGQLWYEMRQGETRLGDDCRYLVRRWDDVFLAHEDTGPEGETDLDADFVHGKRETLAPFVVPEVSWGGGVPEDPNRPNVITMPYPVYDEAAHRLIHFAHLSRPFDWAADPRRESWLKLLADLNTAGPEDSVDGKTQDLWDCLHAVVRLDRFAEGSIEEHALALTRIANEIRRRLLTSRRGDATTNELLRLPGLIPYRVKKDPRDLKILDPACGSGHFLLYAFDLLEAIYHEAWEDSESPPSEATGRTLREDYRDLDKFHRAIPGLILKHNLHGIEIDPRARQVAGMALWLRAQRAFKALGLKGADRPAITESNLVLAEPMPGEPDLLKDYVAETDRRLHELVGAIWEKMKLAGDAGSLLKIEAEIANAVAIARTKALADDGVFIQHGLFAPNERPHQLTLPMVSDDDRAFWNQAEPMLFDALRAYATQAEGAQATRRRLFRDDAERGFAFVDLCQQQFDVVVMNPPFGEASVPSQKYIEETYGDAKDDVYKAFVECSHDRLLPDGLLGIISSRTGLFLAQSQDWRERVVLLLFRPIVLVDLGIGVLDAMVEAAAYVLRSINTEERYDLSLRLSRDLITVPTDKEGCFTISKYQAHRGGLKRHQARQELRWLQEARYIRSVEGPTPRFVADCTTISSVHHSGRTIYPRLTCFRLVHDLDKAAGLLDTIQNLGDTRRTLVSPAEFQKIPCSPFAYWATRSLVEAFSTMPCLRDGWGELVRGPEVYDLIESVRLWTEPPDDSIGTGRRWCHYAKGGEFLRYASDVHLVVDLGAALDGRGVFRRPGDDAFYFRSGITYTQRTTSSFNSRVLPPGCLTSPKGPAIVSMHGTRSLYTLLAITNSECFANLIELRVGAAAGAARSYDLGILRDAPTPPYERAAATQLTELAEEAVRISQKLTASSELSAFFQLPPIVSGLPMETLSSAVSAAESHVHQNAARLSRIQGEIEAIVWDLYEIPQVERDLLSGDGGTDNRASALSSMNTHSVDVRRIDHADYENQIRALLQWSIGVVFGRWDVRFATRESSIPEIPHPFDPLPAWSAGTLVDSDGMPARETPTNYPLLVAWDGVIVDSLDHPEDIVGRIREVLELLWPSGSGSQAEAIERETCEILGVNDLREYFRKTAGFFADHLKRYSKSRRQAPIYWPLSTASGSYTLWIYYHRLSADSLYTVLNRFVGPKLAEVERALGELEGKLAAASGREATRLRAEADAAKAFLGELRDFREELRRVAALPYRPDLNDGVIINAAPLHKLFRLPRWAKDTRECWEKLQRGDYDWAHLAYTMWPERVREKCRYDRSLAIAHDLEDLCEKPATPAKRARVLRDVDDAEVGDE